MVRLPNLQTTNRLPAQVDGSRSGGFSALLRKFASSLRIGRSLRSLESQNQLEMAEGHLDASMAIDEPLDASAMPNFPDDPSLRPAISIMQDFQSLDAFLDFAKANAVFFNDQIERNIIRHCQLHGIQTPALGFCGPDQIAVIGPESREHLMVGGLNSRQRAVIEELHGFIAERKFSIEKIRVYGHEAITPLALFLRGRFPRYLGTEYAPGEEGRANLFPISHGDICHSEFRSSSFDAIISCDVLEHVPDIDQALRESARILVAGGRLIATMPFFYQRQDSVRFAALIDDTVKFLIEPPIYHGNPVDPEGGALVFEIPGWDLVDRAKLAGFGNAFVRFICDQNKGIVASSLGEPLRAKGVFVAIFEK